MHKTLSDHDPDASLYDPHNFLLKGGNRAVTKENEDRLVNLNTAAVRDLRHANQSLAAELLRLQTSSQQDNDAYKATISKIKTALKSEQDKTARLRGRLAEEAKLRSEIEQQHHARLKGLSKRCREQHVLRSSQSLELGQLQDQLDDARRRLEESEAEASQLAAQLSELRAVQGKLDARAESEAAVVQELRSRLSSAESRLEMEVGGRAELWQSKAAVEAQNAALADKIAELTREVQHGKAVKEQLAVAQQQLQEERAATAELRKQHAAAGLEVSELAGEKVALFKQANKVPLLQQEVTDLRQQLQHQHHHSKQRVEQLTEQLEQQRQWAEQRQQQLAEQLDQQRASQKQAVAAAQQAAREEVERAGALQRQQLDQQRRDFEEQLVVLQRQLGAREERARAEAQSKLTAVQASLGAAESTVRQQKEQMRACKDVIGKLECQLSSYQGQGQVLGAEVMAGRDKAKGLAKDVARLQNKLQEAEAALKQKDVATSELLASHSSQLDLWRAELSELSSSVSDWKHKCGMMQIELDAKDSDMAAVQESTSAELSRRQVVLEAVTADLHNAKLRAAAVQEAAVAEQQHVKERLRGAENRLRQAAAEADGLRQQLQRAHLGSEAVRLELESVQEELKGKEVEMERLQLRMSEEQSRTTKLRAELANTMAAHIKDLDARCREVSDTVGRARSTDQELARVKQQLAAAQAEVQQARAAAADIAAAKSRAEDLQEDAQTALRLMQRKAQRYKKENKILSSDYDGWVRKLVNNKDALLSPERASTTRLRASGTTLGSRLSSDSDGDIEKYDRIAELLEQRQQQARLNRRL